MLNDSFQRGVCQSYVIYLKSVTVKNVKSLLLLYIFPFFSIPVCYDIYILMSIYLKVLCTFLPKYSPQVMFPVRQLKVTGPILYAL